MEAYEAKAESRKENPNRKNTLGPISLQARMYEEARVIEIRRRQREVYERIKALFVKRGGSGVFRVRHRQRH